ncbi:acyl-CoA-binding domain-containing protein 5-like [Lolium rigidum]|uniref:acyl-CoA-binding domain-containing protein 5-like n=1 Tax=Lolium rigidum TaxID=89674 RepID=UPI001F5DACF1|nr:acyl-CoA-binding domain-containing protein 5-like [Lolium rigidum]
MAPREVPDEVARESASEVAPTAIPDVVARESASQVAPITHAVDMEEELKEQSVEEVAGQDEQVLNKEEAQCEATPVDQQEKPVHNEELLVPKADDLNVSQQGSSIDKAAVQLPEKEAVTLPGTPEDEASANMEFEEWEGIERSEVEKRFGAAAAFAASDAGASALSKLDSDVQLQLQGLLKVAVDGPCYDSAQPLTLRPSSRAKWVSWQKLGNMHPEIAMGKYMDLLSEVIPRWIGDKTSSTKRHEGDVDSEGAAVTMTGHTSDPQAFRGNEGSTSIDEGPLTSPPNPEKGKSCDIPAE